MIVLWWRSTAYVLDWVMNGEFLMKFELNCCETNWMSHAKKSLRELEVAFRPLESYRYFVPLNFLLYAYCFRTVWSLFKISVEVRVSIVKQRSNGISIQLVSEILILKIVSFSSITRMKSVALNILNTLTKQDYVNVVVSRSQFWTDEGEYNNHTSETLSCEKHRLVPASTSHKKQLAAAIEEIVPLGGSNHM